MQEGPEPREAGPRLDPPGRKGYRWPAFRGRWHGIGVLAGAMLMVGSARAAAQTGGVEGRVWDPSGAPVYAAAVQLIPADGVTPFREAETNRVGYFRVEDLAPGGYVLHVVRLGFQELSRELVINPGRRTQVDVTLVVAAVEVEGVAVTCTQRDPWAVEPVCAPASSRGQTGSQ